MPTSLSRLRPFVAKASITLFALMILGIYLSPFGYMTVTGFKNSEMITKHDAPLWPAMEKPPTTA